MQGQGAVDLTYTRGIARIEFGDIAQLGERCVRIAEVGGSNPPISTMKFWKAELSALPLSPGKLLCIAVALVQAFC